MSSRCELNQTCQCLLLKIQTEQGQIFFETQKKILLYL